MNFDFLETVGEFTDNAFKYVDSQIAMYENISSETKKLNTKLPTKIREKTVADLNYEKTILEKEISLLTFLEEKASLQEILTKEIAKLPVRNYLKKSLEKAEYNEDYINVFNIVHRSLSLVRNISKTTRSGLGLFSSSELTNYNSRLAFNVISDNSKYEEKMKKLYEELHSSTS